MEQSYSTTLVCRLSEGFKLEKMFRMINIVIIHLFAVIIPNNNKKFKEKSVRKESL